MKHELIAVTAKPGSRRSRALSKAYSRFNTAQTDEDAEIAIKRYKMTICLARQGLLD